MRASVLTPLLLLVWSLRAMGQSSAPPFRERPSLETQSPAASENELKLVVALFRHGVRAPLPNFAKTADECSGQDWPSIEAWDVPPNRSWGDLTTRGQILASALGSYYAEWYRKKAWPGGFKVYLWADTDLRTIDTADALDQGFQLGGIPKKNITVTSLATNLSPKNVDPLFHPFEAKCGTPDTKALGITVANIEKGRQQAAQKLKASFEALYGVLGCKASPCFQLKMVVDHVDTCTDSKDCESPISWYGRLNGKCYAGQFPYASSASEAFLLEYANNMAPNLIGWGKVHAANNLPAMMHLHEAYFDLAVREPYLGTIQGSNLTREIRDLLDRTAERLAPIHSNCLRADKASQFIGLIGHDTNIAGVGKLLDLSWQFADADLPHGERLPPDTLNLPRNDALPAGALVFELRERAGRYFIRIDYVAQSLLQMRGDPKRPPTAPFRFSVTCHDERGASLNPCEMPLDTFDKLATKALGPNNPFLSRCADGQQVCP